MTDASISSATSACSARISVGAGLALHFENTLANQSHVSLHLGYSANHGLEEGNEVLSIFRLEP